MTIFLCSAQTLSFAVQKSDNEEVSWSGLGGCEGVLRGQIVSRNYARYSTKHIMKVRLEQLIMLRKERNITNSGPTQATQIPISGA